jgi:uncharacterized protein YjiS (DUF1127 family)
MTIAGPRQRHRSYDDRAAMNASENRQRGRSDCVTTVLDMTMFTAIARYFRASRCYDNAMRELSHLTDRELADIGISRCDIPRLAREHSIAETAIPAGADRACAATNSPARFRLRRFAERA